ncbi:MAG: glycoside hydrolase family 3 C-terminal domain-containing protein [Salinibacterium sp.]|nr:glycoside hydrolase family 3 C-terminal domain-containing protein [Salinibacterium sp.]
MPDLSLEQKAALVVGGGFWATASVEEAGILPVVLTDGPHGVRLQRTRVGALGIASSVPATCFPPAAGLASSWNPALVERVGVALGEESRAEGVGVLLGPGVNIKRSPLCGRNFEYFSEDPLLSGELGAAWVRGVQSRGIGASLKHFAANNQETNRMTVSAEVDERTLRELYLSAFERVVTREQPWTVMCSYNRINGVAAAENHWLLTEVLREEWGFRGLVVSDWGAVEHLGPALAAGLDLEMPGPQNDSVDAVVAAVRAGELDQVVLDTAVRRVRHLVDRAGGEFGGASGGEDSSSSTRFGAHHALAREAATESMVLLRNEGSLLPIDTAQAVGVIGEFARTPRIQGAGSSQVSATRIDTALDSIGALAPVEFAPGYSFDKRADEEQLRAEAVAVATRSDVVLLFVGLPAEDESEGYDRANLDLPVNQLRLIGAVVAANPRTVVILTNGGVVSLEPWHDSVPAIIETWLLGQAGGAALADVLFGRAAPSGRLAESIPLRVQDTPSYLNFPGDGDIVRYGEGIFVGYRYYETIELPVRYPFGFGLSYTTFAYSGLEVSHRGSIASVTVTNTGSRAGKEVVQLYISAPTGGISVPRRELRAFEKVSLDAGESVRVQFTLDSRAYSYWDVVSSGWVVAGGTYVVEVGSSAHEILDTATVVLPAPRPGRLTLDSRVSDFLGHPVTGPILTRAAAGEGESKNTNLLEMVSSMPMRRLMRFPGVGESFKRIGVLLALANNSAVRGIATFFHKR